MAVAVEPSEGRGGSASGWRLTILLLFTQSFIGTAHCRGGFYSHHHRPFGVPEKDLEGSISGLNSGPSSVFWRSIRNPPVQPEGEETFQVCSARLKFLLDTHCNRNFNNPFAKRSSNTSLRRVARGVVDDCCKKSCTLTELLKYCGGSGQGQQGSTTTTNISNAAALQQSEEEVRTTSRTRVVVPEAKPAPVRDFPLEKSWIFALFKHMFIDRSRSKEPSPAQGRIQEAAVRSGAAANQDGTVEGGDNEDGLGNEDDDEEDTPPVMESFQGAPVSSQGSQQGSHHHRPGNVFMAAPLPNQMFPVRPRRYMNDY